MVILTKRLRSALNLGGLTLREAAVRTWRKSNEDEILTRAAALAFYAFAAVVPFLALLIALTAQVLPEIGGPHTANSAEARSIGPLEPLRGLMPAEAVDLIARELKRLQDEPPTGLISIGLVVTIWLSSSWFLAIMEAMNRILGASETRPFWKLRLTAALMTLGMVAVLGVVLPTTLVLPRLLEFLGVGRVASELVHLVHAVLVFIIVSIGFAATIYFAPSVRQRWEWITPGSVTGALVLMLVSYVFRFYVRDWGDYGATYGSLGGVVVLMFWLWLCGIDLLAAAELNTVIKHASPFPEGAADRGGAPAP